MKDNMLVWIWLIIIIGLLYWNSQRINKNIDNINMLKKEIYIIKKELLRLSKLNSEMSGTLDYLIEDYFNDPFDQAYLLTEPQESGCLKCH